MLFITKNLDYKKTSLFILPLFISYLLFLFLYFKPLYNNLHNSILIHWTTDEMSFFTVSNFLAMYREKLSNLII